MVGKENVIRLLERRFAVKVQRPSKMRGHTLAKVEQWPSWARHIRRIELRPSGPLTPKSEGEIQLTNGIRSKFRMEELNPGKNWKFGSDRSYG